MAESPPERPWAARQTIKDVARSAGVGVGTVSRVLQGRVNVSAATRTRVLDAIDRLQFTPHFAGRALRSRRSGLLGVLVPFATRHLYVELLRGVEEAMDVAERTPVFYNVRRAEQKADLLRRIVQEHRVDGLLVISLSLTPGQLDAYRRGSLPLVLADGQGTDCPWVAFDHADAARQAVAYLLSLGHADIAVIDRPQDPFAADEVSPRLAGVEAAFAAACGRFDPRRYLVAEHSRAGGAVAVHALVERKLSFSGLFAASDQQALGAIEALRRLGRRVPDDVSVMGYHDIELAGYVGLTTIRLPTTDLGRQAVDLLLQALEGQGSGKFATMTLRGELVVRESCRARCP